MLVYLCVGSGVLRGNDWILNITYMQENSDKDLAGISGTDD